MGPNGAGKSTFINILAGLTTKTSGVVKIWNIDIDKNHRQARTTIGVVPQELNIDPFFTPMETLELHAGLYGVKSKNRKTKEILELVGLLKEAHSYTRELSGGMKRRLLIAKAMVHSPPILVLDEPTAGVDVKLRHQLWKNIKDLNAKGTTILLTTHYIEEAEAIADRVGVMNHGELILVEEKNELIKKMGQKKLIVELQSPINSIPAVLQQYNLDLSTDGSKLSYTYDAKSQKTGITSLLQSLRKNKIRLKDLKTEQSSLENIFVNLVKEKKT